VINKIINPKILISMKYSLLFLSIFAILYSCKKDDNIAVSEIDVTQTAVNIKIGAKQLLNITVKPDNASDKSLLWSSRNNSIAKVDSIGTVTGKSFGSTYVVAVSLNGSFKDSCLVNVINGTDSLAMGASLNGISYPNDIYYSFQNGIISSVPRTNWDIAFKTNARSSSILINSINGINLWEIPVKDTAIWGEAKWSTVPDTAGLKNAWTSLIDSDTTWSFSAFERNATGHPDYGWGVYNSLTHDVNGIGLFIIQLSDKSYKKIWIKKRAAANSTYTFKYANLDGSSTVNASIPCSSYATKNYVYFNLTSGNIIDREPASSSWDLVLTRYLEMISAGGPTKVPYPVTGFLQNEGITVAEITGDVTSDNYDAATFLTAKDVIGSDWKSFNQGTNAWSLKANTLYFVKTSDQSIFKVVFTKFEGSSTGKVVFEKTKEK
jgi:hypothetical protein